MPNHTTIRDLGSINASDIAPAYGASGIIVPTDTGGDTFAVLNAAQTLTNKTLTTPVIASLKQASSGGTINMPTVASGQTKTLATTDAIPSILLIQFKHWRVKH